MAASSEGGDIIGIGAGLAVNEVEIPLPRRLCCQDGKGKRLQPASQFHGTDAVRGDSVGQLVIPCLCKEVYLVARIQEPADQFPGPSFGPTTRMEATDDDADFHSNSEL